MLTEEYTKQIIASLIVFAIAFGVRFIASRMIKRFSQSTALLERRSNLIDKYISMLITIVGVIALSIIWGVQAHNVVTSVYAVLTLLGIALFAQWSVLSNITAAVILFFAFPFKIGDRIKILDGDFDIEGEIEDIRAFHTLLRTSNGEIITYPNNLMLQKGIRIITEPVQEQEFTD